MKPHTPLSFARGSVTALLLVLALPGTAAAGIDEGKLKQLTVGKTTESEILKLFGKPAAINEGGDGSRTLNYLGGRWVPNPQLDILIGRDNKLKDFTFREISVRGSFRKVDPGVLESLKEGESRIRDVERAAGQAAVRVVKADGSTLLTYNFRGKEKGEAPSAGVLVFDGNGVLTSLAGFTAKMDRGKQQQVDPTRWALITEDRTTGDEVIQLLGKPTMALTSPDGGRVFMYYKFSAMGQEMDYYQVQVSGDGTVSALGRNSIRYDAGTKISETGVKIEPEKWRAITPGTTTEADVIELVGQPNSVIRLSDASKVYLFEYSFTQMKRFSVKRGGESRMVAFDVRGVVRSVDDFRDPNNLEARNWDGSTGEEWESLEKARADASVVRTKMGTPACMLPAQEGLDRQVYLYSKPNGELTAYFPSTAPAALIPKSLVSMRDLNALGKKFQRSGGRLTRVGQTTHREIEDAVGFPHFQLTSSDGGTWKVYLTGALSFGFPGASSPSQQATNKQIAAVGLGAVSPSFDFKQTIGLVALKLDAGGVLRFAQVGCTLDDPS